MERRKFGNSDLTVSTIGLGCYGMSGAYGPADDAESIATIRRARAAVHAKAAWTRCAAEATRVICDRSASKA
jgi:hypothetical protein